MEPVISTMIAGPSSIAYVEAHVMACGDAFACHTLQSHCVAQKHLTPKPVVAQMKCRVDGGALHLGGVSVECLQTAALLMTDARATEHVHQSVCDLAQQLDAHGIDEACK